MEKILFRKVALILPMGRFFDELFTQHLRVVLQTRGAEAMRVDTEFSAENQLGTICSEIEKSELVLADITGKNPNVMFLAGYAQGIGRKVLLLVQNGEDFPFDRNKHPAIIYHGNGAFLASELERFLKGVPGAMTEPETEPRPTSSIQQQDGKDKFLEIFGDLMTLHGQEHKGEIYMENPTTFVLVDQDLELALVQDLARRARELGLRIKLL